MEEPDSEGVTNYGRQAGHSEGRQDLLRFRLQLPGQGYALLPQSQSNDKAIQRRNHL